jgi:glycosyltransferase involved in cell wall biosynthesis
LGYALNQGIDTAVHEYIAYLPSDDYYYPEHLQSLSEALSKSPDMILAYSGIRYENGDSFNPQTDEETTEIKSGAGLQLVQTANRKTDDRWVERSEWVTGNLFDMFWRKLIDKGIFIATKQISCFWTSHPKQRHKIISEVYGGGLNFYRNYYNVKTPIKMKVSAYKFVDEESMYASFRKKQPKAKDGLKILLVGELAYHPERIYALEEQGHSLYGLWTDDVVFSFSTIGYLPFGNVQYISRKNWQEEVRKIKPDII